MCIEKKIAELEKKIAQLKKLQQAVLPVKTALTALFEDFAAEAPEELPEVWSEILHIGSQYQLAVHSLSNHRLQELEAANAENERLKLEVETLRSQVTQLLGQITERVAAGDEEAQAFAANAMNQAIEQRASVAFKGVEATEGVQQVVVQDSPPEPEYESEETYDTVDSILKSTGFQHPEQFFTFWDAKEKYESYQGWDIYFSVPNGGIVAIGLHSPIQPESEAWDASTEIIQELDPTFPEFLDDFDEIVAWTRQLIDRVENLEASGQQQLFSLKFSSASESNDILTDEEYDAAVEEELALDEEDIPELGGNWAEDLDETDLQKLLKNKSEFVFENLGAKEQEPVDLIQKFLITNLPLPDQMRARVTPAVGNGKFAGATFTFYRGTEELFTSSRTAEEIARGENNPELIAVALAQNWLKRQELKNSPPVGTTHTEPRPKDDFTELVYLSDAVAYLKRKDTGEILSCYIGFSNKTAEGDRAPTMAKSRATKWQEHLAGVYQLACSGLRECQRIESRNPKMPFKYELKLVKPSMAQIRGLATENFGLYPNEIKEKREGSEARSEVPPTEETKLSDFEFEKIADFDELNPEFSVSYKGEYLTRIWSSLRTTVGQQPQRLWRHRLLAPGEEIELKDRDEVAFHALQRTRGLA